MRNSLKTCCLFFGFLIFSGYSIAQSEEQDRISNLVNNLKFVKDIPYICEDSVYVNNQPGCGDRIFWRVIEEKKAAIPFLIDKLDDTTQTVVPVPNFGGF